MNFKEWFLDKLDDIQHFFKDYFFFKPRRFFRYIQSLPSIIKITWETNNPTDYISVVYLMIWKITQLRDHIQEHQAFEDWEERVKEMNEFLEKINFGIGDKHPEEFIKAEQTHKEVFGDADVDFETSSNGTINLITKYQKDLTEKEKELERENRTALYDLSATLENKHWEEAFKILSEKMRGWWC